MAFPFIPPLDVTLSRGHFLLSDAPSPDARKQMLTVVSADRPSPCLPQTSQDEAAKVDLRPGSAFCDSPAFISAGAVFPSFTPSEVNTVSWVSTEPACPSGWDTRDPQPGIQSTGDNGQQGCI